MWCARVCGLSKAMHGRSLDYRRIFASNGCCQVLLSMECTQWGVDWWGDIIDDRDESRPTMGLLHAWSLPPIPFVFAGRVVDVNSLWVSLLGWRRQEIVDKAGDDWTPMVYRHPCQHDSVFNEWMSTTLVDPLSPISDEVLTKDGHVLTVRALL